VGTSQPRFKIFNIELDDPMSISDDYGAIIRVEDGWITQTMLSITSPLTTFAV
jgi:hypothetical protein